jgi:prepilin-type processing-associated H-X9-DG protein
MTVDDPVSGQTFGYPVSDRYPWRLVGEVSHVWQIIHGHDQLPPVPRMGDSAADAFSKAYTLSISPAYGINSVYVGGDADYNGFVGDRPNTGKHVVFKATEVRRPSELIVFADCHAANIPTMIGQGYHLLTPPHAHGLKWTVVNGVARPASAFGIIGLPMGWYTRRVVTGFFDGHVEAMLPEQLQDMRLWANRAATVDYDYAP